MQPSSTKFRWDVICRSRRGASHKLKKLPNQDYVGHDNLPDGSIPVILAVADGHGSETSFRSQVGSALAVKSAIAVVKEFYKGLDFDNPSLSSSIKAAAETKLPAHIVKEWKQKVYNHIQSNPFTVEEIDLLSSQKKDTLDLYTNTKTQDHLQLAYGTTLLVALITDRYLLCFQLGDGDIVAISDTTGKAERLIAKDSNIANETDSLCCPDPVRYFRFYFRHYPNQPPGLVLLSTDGYFNSFEHGEEGYVRNCRSYLDIIIEDGAGFVDRELAEWLDDYSQQGSGDDISLGILFRTEPPLSLPLVEQQVILKDLPNKSIDLSGPDAEQTAASTTNPLSYESSGDTTKPNDITQSSRVHDELETPNDKKKSASEPTQETENIDEYFSNIATDDSGTKLANTSVAVDDNSQTMQVPEVGTNITPSDSGKKDPALPNTTTAPLTTKSKEPDKQSDLNTSTAPQQSPDSLPNSPSKDDQI